MGEEDLEGGLDDLVGDLEGDFGDGDVREAENEFRDERISGLFFSLFSLSLSFLKKWASWTIGGGEVFFFFSIEGGRIGEISRCEPRMGGTWGISTSDFLQNFNFLELEILFGFKFEPCLVSLFHFGHINPRQ